MHDWNSEVLEYLQRFDQEKLARLQEEGALEGYLQGKSEQGRERLEDLLEQGMEEGEAIDLVREDLFED